MNKRILIALLFISITGYTQEVKQDFESWNSITLKYKLKKKWTFSLDSQIRLDENASEVKNFFFDLLVERKLFKGFKLGVGGRYNTKNDNKGKVQGLDDFMRVYGQAKYKHNIERFEFKYRLRYQYSEELAPEEEINVQYIRFKLATGYNIRKWKLDPQIYGEVFNHLNHVEDGQRFDGYRYGIGTSYKFSKKSVLSGNYRIEKNLNELYPKTTYIFKLNYTYTF